MPTRPTHFVRRHAVLLTWLCALAGCTAPPAIVAPGRVQDPVRLVLINLAAQAWEVSVAPVEAGAARVEHLRPQATREVALPAGEYSIEQVLLAADGNRAIARRLVVRFEAGRTYRWPLAVLEPDAIATAGDGGVGGGR